MSKTFLPACAASSVVSYMDLDDKQAFTHLARGLVECAFILRQEIQKKPFTEAEAEEMLLAYWRTYVNHLFTPNFADIFSKMIPGGEDDD